MFKLGAVIKAVAGSKGAKSLLVLGAFGFMGFKVLSNDDMDKTDSGNLYDVQIAEQTTIQQEQLPLDTGAQVNKTVLLPSTISSETTAAEGRLPETSGATETTEASETEPVTETVVEETEPAAEVEEAAFETTQPDLSVLPTQTVEAAPVQNNAEADAQAQAERDAQAAAEAERIQAQAQAEREAAEAAAEAERQAQLAAEAAERARIEAEEAARLQPNAVYVNGKQVNGYSIMNNVFTGVNTAHLNGTITVTDAMGNPTTVTVNPTPRTVLSEGQSHLDWDSGSDVGQLMTGAYGTVFTAPYYDAEMDMQFTLLYSTY